MHGFPMTYVNWDNYKKEQPRGKNEAVNSKINSTEDKIQVSKHQ